MALNIHINHSLTDLPLLSSGVDWIQVDPDNDGLIMSNGSDLIADGEASPGETALNSAGIVLDGTEQTKVILQILIMPIYLIGLRVIAITKKILLTI